MVAGFRTVIAMDAFDGGLNSKYEPQIIADNEAQGCLNVVFDDLGGVETRQGHTLLNTFAVNTNACDGLFTARWNSGNESMVAFFGPDMFVLSGTTFQTVPSGQGVFTTGVTKYAQMYQNLLFVGHAGTAYKYDSNAALYRHRIETPSAATNGGTRAAGGNLAGDYHYKLSYVNTQVVEGQVGTGSSTLVASAGGESMLLSGVPVPSVSFGVNTKYLYRTYANSGVSGTYYFLASMAASATTYNDTIASSSLGAAAPTDNGQPPSYSYIKHHQERLFLTETSTNPQYLWYSEIGNPFIVKSTSFIKIADGDGEKITGFGIQGNSLVVFKEDSVWLIEMPDTDPATWRRKKTDSKYGCASQNSVVEFGNLLMFLGQQKFKLTGFYALQGAGSVDGATVTNISQDATVLTSTNVISDAKSDKIEPDVFLFQNSYKANAVAIQFNNKVWVAVTHGASQTTNNRIYQFDFVRRDKSRSGGSWVPFTGMSAKAFTVYNNILYFGSSASDGKVHRADNGTFSDNGSAINSYYWSKEFDGGRFERHFDKDFRQANFTVETLGNWLMRVFWYIDADEGSGNSADINLNPGGSLWGTMRWGSDVWGGGQTRKDVKVELGQAEGKRISVKFTNMNTVSQGFKVIRGNVYYNRRGLR